MESLREKHLACVVDNLSYFNDCKTSFAISECKSWINKIFDDVEALQQRSCDGCKYFRNSDKACFMSSHNTYDRPASIKFSGCGKFKPKEQ